MPSLFGNLFHRRATAGSATSSSDDKEDAGGPALPTVGKYSLPPIEASEACGIMAENLHSAIAKGSTFAVDVAAAVRIARGDFAIYPSLEARPELSAFALGLHKLDVDVGVCLTERMVVAMCRSLEAGCYVLRLTETTHVQVVDTMDE